LPFSGDRDLDHEAHETARKIRKVVSPFVHFALFRGIRDPNATTIMAMSVPNDPLGDPSGLAGKGVEFPPGVRVPDLERFVPTGGDYPGTVRAEAGPMDWAGMVEDVAQLTGPHISSRTGPLWKQPKPGRAVPTGGQDLGTLRAELNARDGIGVAFEGVEEAPGRHIPYTGAPVFTPSDELGAGRAERDRA
jgi:hypothetical protein